MAVSQSDKSGSNVTPLTRPGARSASLPAIRKIGMAELTQSLSEGWDDFKAIPSHGVMIALIYPVLGLALARAVQGYSVLPLLFPLAAGFALLGPFAAVGLYELSRRRENGEQPTVLQAFEVLRAPSLGAMLSLGAILLVLFLVWIATAQAIYNMTFGYAPVASMPDFAQKVLSTPEGVKLIVLGCGAGFVFALVALGLSVVSFPLMLDRHASLSDAIVTSLRAFKQNPVAMAGWGVIVAALLALGSIPAFIGLAVVIPVLGHATWHLYRKVVG